jgi:uncharacterized damage-inducible protein DinB
MLLELMRYNNWANAALIHICQELGPEQLAASAPGAYGTIHDTLAHMAKGQADYVARIKRERFNWEEKLSLEAVAAMMAESGQALLELMQSVAPASIVREEEGTLWIQYQARVLFMQAIIHGVEHRTNITTILTGLGHKIPELDNWGYMWTHTELFETQEGDTAKSQ